MKKQPSENYLDGCKNIGHEPSEPKEKPQPMTNGEKEIAKGLDEYFDKEKSEPKDVIDKYCENVRKDIDFRYGLKDWNTIESLLRLDDEFAKYDWYREGGSSLKLKEFLCKELATAKQQGYEEGFTIGSEWKKNRTEELERARQRGYEEGKKEEGDKHRWVAAEIHEQSGETTDGEKLYWAKVYDKKKSSLN